MKKEYDLSKLKKATPRYLKNIRQPVTMRLDSEVIDYFKNLASKTGIPYQALINYVLKDYSANKLSPSACWPEKN